MTMIWVLCSPLLLFACVFLAFGLKNVLKHEWFSAVTYLVLAIGLIALSAWFQVQTMGAKKHSPESVEGVHGTVDNRTR